MTRTFSNVVPDPEYSLKGGKSIKELPSQYGFCHDYLRFFVKNRLDRISMVMILLNAVSIGVQTEHRAQSLQAETPLLYLRIERCFAVFFLFDLLCRVFAFGSRWFCAVPDWKWNWLDATVVSLQVVEECINMFSEGSFDMAGTVSVMRMLRILRLVRVVRVVRLLRFMTELRTIAHSMMGSLKPLFSTVILLLLIFYIVGLYLTQVTSDHMIDTGVVLPELRYFFGSVPMTVLSLFQALTGGLEWREMLEPLLVHVSPWMGILFSVYIVFTMLALMNIVTGVFVDTALTRGRKAKEVFLINDLKALFTSLDFDNSGSISWDEFLENLEDKRLNSFLREIDLDAGEAKGLFTLLDRDGEGNIDADEFLSGCLRLHGPAKALDMQLILRELAEQRKSFEYLTDLFHKVADDDSEVEAEDAMKHLHTIGSSFSMEDVTRPRKSVKDGLRKGEPQEEDSTIVTST